MAQVLLDSEMLPNKPESNSSIALWRRGLRHTSLVVLKGSAVGLVGGIAAVLGGIAGGAETLGIATVGVDRALMACTIACAAGGGIGAALSRIRQSGMPGATLVGGLQGAVVLALVLSPTAPPASRWLDAAMWSLFGFVIGAFVGFGLHRAHTSGAIPEDDGGS